MVSGGWVVVSMLCCGWGVECKEQSGRGMTINDNVGRLCLVRKLSALLFRLYILLFRLYILIVPEECACEIILILTDLGTSVHCPRAEGLRNNDGFELLDK